MQKMSSTHSLNHLMHPRNPYKNSPPDFTQLAATYPDLRKHCVYKNDKVAINFRSDDAVRELTRAILHKDFGLTVLLPKGSLVPRVPQKLNYLLWIEDILLLNNIEKNVYAIDIGTGASCIYSLLGASLKKWKFIGSDVDKSSLRVAGENIENNNLTSFVSLFHVRKDDMLMDLVHENSEIQFTFCMCNPPFFEGKEADQRFQFSSIDGGYVNNASLEGDQGNDNLLSSKRGPPGRPSSITVAKANELIIEGGEVAFVNRIIDDSLWLQKSIKVYTTMLGKKTSLTAIIHRLSQIRNLCFNYSSLNQGKTKRWVIVWTYNPDLYIHDDTLNENDLVFDLPEALSTTKNNAFAWIQEQLGRRKVDIFHQGRYFLRCEAFNCTWNKTFLKREAFEKANFENPLLEMEEDEPPTKRGRISMIDAGVDVKLGSLEGKDSLNNCGNFVDCVRFQSQGNNQRADCGVQAWFPGETKPIVRFTVYQSPSSKTKFFFTFEEGAKDRLGHLVTFLHNTARQQLSKMV